MSTPAASTDAARTYAVTAVGPDAPGEVAALAEVLAGLGASLADASMTRLRGHFAMTLVAELPAGSADRGAVQAALEAAGTGLHVVVWELDPAAEPPAVGPAYRLTVHGADRPGIVAELARTVARFGGNITDLTCRLAGGLYVVAVEVDLPTTDGLEQALQALRASGLQVHLEPADEDVL